MKRYFYGLLMFIAALFAVVGCDVPTYNKPTGKIVINNSAACPCSLKVTLDTLDYGDISKSKTVDIGSHTLIITTMGICDTVSKDTCHFTGGSNTFVCRLNINEEDVKIVVVSGNNCQSGLAVDCPH
jgi:hypothetical protein